MVMVFNATFKNISVISWWSVPLVEETGVPRENNRPVASHWQTWSHNVVSSIYRNKIHVYVNADNFKKKYFPQIYFKKTHWKCFICLQRLNILRGHINSLCSDSRRYHWTIIIVYLSNSSYWIAVYSDFTTKRGCFRSNHVIY